MGILSQLAEVNIKELLSTCLKQNFGIQLKWEWNEEIVNGQDIEMYYVEIVKNEANAELLQQFIQEWMPIYEQLSLHHDYFKLRSVIVQKDSYNVTVQLEELMNDVHIPRLELWMDATNRGQLINELDESLFEEKKFSKRHLHYLAINALSTKELYKMIELKMTQNGMFVHSYSEQLQLQITQNFQTIQQAIQLYDAKQEIEVMYILTDKLEGFYIWLKGLITAMKNQILREG